MVFVHARKETVKTAKLLRGDAASEGMTSFFEYQETSPEFGNALKEVGKSKNQEMKDLFSSGFGIHHAGTSLLINC